MALSALFKIRWPAKNPIKIPNTMKNWLRVPAGAPIEPGRIDVRNVGIRIVLMPVTIPNNILDQVWVVIDRSIIPMTAATIVSISVTLKVSIHPNCLK